MKRAINLKENHRITLRYFISALAVSFLTLALFLSFFVLKSKPITLFPNRGNGASNIYLPSADEKMSILLTISKSTETTPYLAALIYFDPIGGEIPIVSFPANCMLIIENKNETLDKIIGKVNINQIKKGFENYTGVKIDKYINIKSDGLADLIDLSGNIEVKIPFKIKLDNSFTVNTGIQNLDGIKATKILEIISDTPKTTYISSISSDILSAFVNNLLSFSETQKSERIFNSLVNNSDTDITYDDFEKRKRALKFLNKLKDNASYGLIMQGQLNDAKNTFTFSQNSLKQLKDIFS